HEHAREPDREERSAHKEKVVESEVHGQGRDGLFQLLPAEDDHPDGGGEQEDADDLNRQPVGSEKEFSDAVDIAASGLGDDGESLAGSGPATQHQRDQGHEGDGHGRAAREDDEGAALFLLGLQVEEHDDEKEQHHDGPAVDEDLEDADQEGVQLDEEGGQSEKGKHHGEGRADRIAARDHANASKEGQSGEEVEEESH